jgi:predicted DNA-binding transcriptional regulator AlpA
MPARAPKVMVSVVEKWLLTLDEAAAVCNLSDTYVRDLLRKGEFPKRRHVGDADGGKNLFVAAEVRAFAEGRDWRAMVAAREAVAHAS